MSLLIFALTLQHYFLFRTFWYKVGVYSIDAEHTFDVSTRWRTITYANVGEDLQSSYNLPVSSVTDAIACSISLMIAFSSVVGRVGLI